MSRIPHNNYEREGRQNSGMFRFALCGSQESTTNSTVVTRPLTTTRKVLKPKQLMRNTSTSTICNEQQATQFTYLIQTANCAISAQEDQDLYEINKE